ncbi:hypothetical protein E8E13_003705 [Curvularia kusanoi]|uniref:DUF6590 domain-containing protein n=1 Tax=Curvularia kusanoi TaxID=90978 RepID=A0A9P4T772_CURKU|nr:hypothetical protein E8E13_003705 [Curvularia kusanoi]
MPPHQQTDSQWSVEHQQWLQTVWDPNQKRYYWNCYNGNQWVFFDWVPRQRADSGAHQNPSRGIGIELVGTYDGSQATLHYEPLDPSFYVRDKSFFVEGRVFAVILSENAGSTAPTSYNSCISEVRFQGNHVYTGVRRFIVVRPRREYCFACPVFTYSGRGTTKPGVHADEHAVAYDLKKTPLLLPGETGITKASIGVNMEENETLTKASRIYFGIHHPIQYNVKVKNIGCVCAEHIPSLIGSWREEDGRGGQQALDVTYSGHEE